MELRVKGMMNIRFKRMVAGIFAVGFIIGFGNFSSLHAGGTRLIAEWHFDEGAGLEAKDSVGNNNGMLSNAKDAEAKKPVKVVKAKKNEWVNLEHREIISGSETIREKVGGETAYVPGKDYEIDYPEGRIKALPKGNMPALSELTVEYRYNDSGPKWVKGKSGRALEFDGVDDYVRIKNSPEFVFGPNDSFTIEAWIKTTTKGRSQPIVTKGHTGCCWWGIGIYSPGRGSMMLRNSKCKYSIAIDNSKTVDVADGSWHFLTGVRDATGRNVKIYVDGELRQTVNEAGNHEIDKMERRTFIGIGVGGYAWMSHFKGIIDEVRIYKGIRTRSEILRDMMGNVSLSHHKKSMIKAGIYHAGKVYGAEGIYAALKDRGDIEVAYINNFDKKTILPLDVLIIPDIKRVGKEKPGWRARLRAFVESGKGMALFHDSAAGYRGPFAQPLFPEIVKGIGRTESYVVKTKDFSHPVTKSLPQEFTHSFYDHMNLEPSSQGKILITDRKGHTVVVAGEFGAGRIVASGMITGYGKGEAGWQEKAPEKAELTLLVNSIHWLAGGNKLVAKIPLKILVERQRLKLKLTGGKKASLNQIISAWYELETKLDFAKFDLEDIKEKINRREYRAYQKKLDSSGKKIKKRLALLRKEMEERFSPYLSEVDEIKTAADLEKFRSEFRNLPLPQYKGHKFIFPVDKKEKKYLSEIKKIKDELFSSISPLCSRLAQLREEKVPPALPKVKESNQEWVNNNFMFCLLNYEGGNVCGPGWKDSLRYMSEAGVNTLGDCITFRVPETGIYKVCGVKSRDKYLSELCAELKKYNIRVLPHHCGESTDLGQGRPQSVGRAWGNWVKQQKDIARYVIEHAGKYPVFAGIEYDELNAAPMRSMLPGCAYFDSNVKRYTEGFQEYLKNKYCGEELNKLGIKDIEKIAIPSNRKDNKVLWMEYREFVNDTFMKGWKEVFDYARSLKKDIIMWPLLSPSLSCHPFTFRQSEITQLADITASDYYWAGSPSEAFGLDLLRSNAKGPTQQVVGTYYGGNVETYKRDLAMTYAHTQGVFIFGWRGCFKQMPPFRLGSARTLGEPEEIWKATVEFGKRTKKLNRYLVKTTSPAEIGLLFSERNTVLKDVFPRGEVRLGGYTRNQVGIYLALSYAHIQTDPIYTNGLTKEKLDRYKILIVSAAKSLTDEQTKLLQEWVNEGGYLIVSGGTSILDQWGRKQADYKMKDVFGVSFLEEKKSDKNLSFKYNNAKVEYKPGAYDLVKATTGKVMTTWESGEPAVVVNSYGRGRIIFLSMCYPGLSYTAEGEMARSRYLYFSSGIKDFLTDLIKEGMEFTGSRLPFLVKNCPEDAEINMRIQKENRRHILHCLNNSLTNVPVKNVEVSIPLPNRQGTPKVFYGIDHKPIKCSLRSGNLTFKIRDFDIYEMIVVEF